MVLTEDQYQRRRTLIDAAAADPKANIKTAASFIDFYDVILIKRGNRGNHSRRKKMILMAMALLINIVN